jgi:predicted peptidase
MIRNMFRIVLTFLSCTLLATGAVAQAAETAPVDAAKPAHQLELTTMVQSQIHYLLFLPKSYSAKGEPAPLILFLHGSGERGSDLNLVKKWGPPAIVESNPDFPFMVLSPQVPEGGWWQREQLKAMIDDVTARYNVDRHRIYITGLSMGGFGTWEMIMAYPHLFAAAAPICGGGVPLFVRSIKDMPVWAFHGKKDEAVPEEQSANMVAALKEAGGDVKYTVLPDGGHIDA